MYTVTTVASKPHTTLAVDNCGQHSKAHRDSSYAYGMDRNRLLHDLAEVERLMALGEAHLADQEARIAKIDCDSDERKEAVKALAELNAMQDLYEQRRDLILGKILAPTPFRRSAPRA